MWLDTSVNLTNELIKKNTRLIGTLWINRKGNPNEIVTIKLKGEEVTNKIIVIK